MGMAAGSAAPSMDPRDPPTRELGKAAGFRGGGERAPPGGIEPPPPL